MRVDCRGVELERDAKKPEQRDRATMALGMLHIGANSVEAETQHVFAQAFGGLRRCSRDTGRQPTVSMFEEPWWAEEAQAKPTRLPLLGMRMEPD